MAAVAVSDTNLRRQDMEGAVSGTSNIGSGPGPTTTPNFIYQGAQAWIRRVNTASSDHGFWIAITSTNMTVAGDDVVIIKAQYVKPGVLNPDGVKVRIGSSTSNYYLYRIADDGSRGFPQPAYPPKGGFVIIPIDPNTVAWVDVVTTAPTLSAITQIAITANVSATANIDDNAIDAIDFGPGLFLVGGDGGDADGVFQDFVDDDEGQVTAGRFGHVVSVEGIIYVFGGLFIGQTSGGTTTATEFTELNQTVVFPGGFVRAGWNKIDLDLGNASTVVDVDDCVFVGRGRPGIKRFFDTDLDITDANEQINIPSHGFVTGDPVRYSNEGGSNVSGLTNNTIYWVRRVDVDTITLHRGSANFRAGAFANTDTVNLTGDSAPGASHSLTLVEDVRPNLVAAGTSGSAAFDGCTFNQFRQLTLTSAVAVTGCKFLGLKGADLGSGATLTDCTIQGAVTEPGEASVVTSDLADISDCAFIAGLKGHAIEIDTAGSYSFDGNTFTGYGPLEQHFHTQDDVDPGTDVVTTATAHGYATGDEVYYEDGGGTDTIGLTDGARYYVRAVSTTTLAFYATREAAEQDTQRIALSDGSTGETHSIYSAQAAIVNTSGGAVTINVGAGGGTPSIRNVGASTTTVQNTVTLTVTVTDSNGDPIENAQVAIFDSSDTELMNEDTNASGVATEPYSFISNEPVSIRVRKTSPGETRYLNFLGSGIITNAGLDVAVLMNVDENAPHQTTIDSYASSNQDAARSLDNTTKFVGQSFAGDGVPLTRAEFFLKRTNALTGTYRFHVYAHTGTFGSTGTPTGTPLASSRLCVAADLLTTYQTIGIAFPKPFTPANGTNYFLVIEYQDGTSSNTLDVGVDSSSPTHGGNVAHSSDGSAWTPIAGEDAVFACQGTP